MFVGIPINTAAEDFILNPGYIDGTITVPGHTVKYGYVYASGTDPETGENYQARSQIINNEYHLVVEGGDWDYRIRFTFRYDDTTTSYDSYITFHNFATVVVPVGETVVVDIETDAVIEGTVSVVGEDVQFAYLMVSGYGYYSQYAPNGEYSIPVFGSEYAQSVKVETVRTTDPFDYMSMNRKTTFVGIGETSVVDFSVTPGYVEGTITVQGAEIYEGNIALYVYNQEEHRPYVASTKISSDGTYRLPVYPHLNYEIYGDVNTNLGIYGLESKFVDVLSGQTSVVNWEIIFDSSISGEVLITGVNLDYVRVQGYGPHGSYRVTTLNTEGDYVFNDLVPGIWGIYVEVYDRETDYLVGYRDIDYYTFAKQYIDLGMSEDVIQDFTFVPGFIEGDIFSEDSSAAVDLYYHELHAKPIDYIGANWAWTEERDFDMNNEYTIDHYDLFVSPYDWTIDNLYLWFVYDYYPGWDTRSTLSLSYAQYPRPYISVEEDETYIEDLDLETGKITPTLKVATGEAFRWPVVWGSYEKSGEYRGNLDVRSDVRDITEAVLTFHAVEGTYDLRGRANVQGATTYFGRMKVVVGPGDIIEIDPDAPIVNIITPTGNSETTESCVTVTGTVTDESEISVFTVNGNTVQIGADDSFSTEVCGLVKGENIIEVYAEDEHGNSVLIERTVILINTPPVASLPDSYTVIEGTEIVFNAGGSTDPDGDTLYYRWDLNNDGIWDTDYSTNPELPHTWVDDYTGTVIVEVYDGHETATATTSVLIENTEPSITQMLATVDPTPVGYSVDLVASFTDEGVLDTHTATIDWNDNTITDGTVTESDGSGTVTGAHTYTTPGVYTIKLTLSDDDGAVVSDEYRYVVVYDPTGSFITGGGQIYSPAGAYVPDSSLSGKATFGFVCKYKNGATTPNGNTEFQFHAGDLNFHSTEYDWLVVAGKKGMFKGTGTINGVGTYKFILSAIDGDLPGGDGKDKFRIKIWYVDEQENEIVVYDNGLGAANDADPTTVITHGSIKIHKA
jgi:hypothetical protein